LDRADGPGHLAGEGLTVRTSAGLVLGVAGVALLMRNQSRAGDQAVLIGAVAILLGTFSWSVGVHFSRSHSLPRNVAARAGMPEITGAVILLAVAGGTGEFTRLHLAAVSLRSVLALLYLIAFGSMLAFTAYTWLLDHASPTLVATHTYVNPIIAVLLGWLGAGEVMDLRVLLAASLTLVAVFLISRGTARSSADLAEEAEAA